MPLKKSDYKQIKKIALSYGLDETDEPGIFTLDSMEIDLTASGATDWAVGKNIIDQVIKY